jgi:hypothetical protein
MEGAGERVGDRIEESAGKVVSHSRCKLLDFASYHQLPKDRIWISGLPRGHLAAAICSFSGVSGLQPLRTVNEPHRPRTSDQHTARSRHSRRVLPVLLARRVQLLMRVPVLLDLFPLSIEEHSSGIVMSIHPVSYRGGFFSSLGGGAGLFSA